MGNLVLPQKVVIQLTDGLGQPFEIPDVVITVHLFARRKNDFYLGPFISDKSGKIIINRKDLENEIKATISTGVMDYYSTEDCFSFVEIYPNQPEAIERTLSARRKFYVSLLDGEEERWGSMENLLNAYRRAKNGELNISKELSRIRDEWNDEKDEYVYSLGINKK